MSLKWSNFVASLISGAAYIPVTLKMTAIIFVIGLYEIMQGALIPCSKTYSYVEGYLAAAVIYWALVFVIERIGNVIEKKSVRFRRRAL